MPTCIYCLKTYTPEGFNKEHVMPKAFGSFANAFTLTDCVCKDCNSFFSRELELYLARDSVEALLRLQVGLKAPQKADQLRDDRLEFAIGIEGPWRGVRLRMKEEAGALVVNLIPQAVFWGTDGAERIAISVEELDVPESWQTKVDTRRGAVVVAPSLEMREQLIRKLRTIGITFTQTTELPPPPSEASSVLTETKFRVDSVIRRAIAKIVFNYATYIHGPGFVIDSAFDVTRRYIRFGDQPGYPLVLVDAEPILYDDLPQMRQTEGHLITLEWAPSGRDVVAQASLFNWIRYRISLARNYGGVWREIRSGHHFDYEDKTIHELRAIPKSLWLPRYI